MLDLEEGDRHNFTATLTATPNFMQAGNLAQGAVLMLSFNVDF
jgi:hypothetical protein